MSPGARVLFWLAALALLGVGLLVGLMGAFVQAQRIIVEAPWGATAIPWGVPVVWVALVSAIRGGAWAIRSRWGSWAVLLGWLAATIVMAGESTSGDVALSGGTRQMVYLFGGVVLGSAAATLPIPLSARRSHQS